jgi:hypothetical protein
MDYMAVDHNSKPLLLYYTLNYVTSYVRMPVKQVLICNSHIKSNEKIPAYISDCYISKQKKIFIQLLINARQRRY